MAWGDNQPIGLLNAADVQNAGLYQGLLNAGAGIAAAGAPGARGPGLGGALAQGAQGFSQGMQQGRQAYIQQAQQDQELARQQGISEALSPAETGSLSPHGQQVRGLLSGLPAQQRGTLALLGPQAQQSALATMLTRHTNPRENYVTVGNRLVNVAGATPTEAYRSPTATEDPAEFARQMALRQAGASRVSVNTALPPQESAFAQTTGKALGEEAGATLAAGRSATETLRRLGQVQQVLETANTGAGAQTMLTLGQYAQRLGIPDSALPSGMDRNAVASTETLRSLSNSMLIGMIGNGGFPSNNFSDADRKTLEAARPGMANSPAGNQTLVEIARLTADRNLQVARSWREFSMRNGNSAESYQRWQAEKLPQITEQNIIAPLVTRPPTGAPAPQVPPPVDRVPQRVGTGGLPRLTDPAQAADLPPGTRFVVVFPDGTEQTRWVPGAPRRSR